MDKYICECCNGKINPRTMKCEYCDTQYKREGGDVIRIGTFRNPVELFKCAAEIPREMILRDPEMASRYACSTIARQLAESVMPYMLFETYYDPNLQETRLTGMIRVVIPKEEGRGFDSRRIME